MPDALVSVSTALDIPPYAQIFEQIRALIERGVLTPGQALPTIRQLAGDLAIAPNTVARAYADLRTDGWIVGEERRRAQVAPRTPALAKTSRRRALSDAVSSFLTALGSRGYDADEIALELRRRLPRLNAAP